MKKPRQNQGSSGVGRPTRRRTDTLVFPTSTHLEKQNPQQLCRGFCF